MEKNHRLNKIKVTALSSSMLSCFFRGVIASLCLLISLFSEGQNTADTIRKEIDLVNHAYDSAFYLTFDIRMTYHSDTIWAGTDSADFRRTEIEGTYTFHRSQALYKLGGLEYLQNDSFTVAVYNDEKIMMVGRPFGNKKSGTFLPTRALVDTAMIYILANYSYTLNTSDSTRFQISLTALDSLALYEKITIEYEPSSHYLLRIAYRVKDPDYDNGSSSAAIERKADLVFLFSRYRVQEAGPSVFDERRYLFYDGPGNIVPADAYRDYTIYKNY